MKRSFIILTLGLVLSLVVACSGNGDNGNGSDSDSAKKKEITQVDDNIKGAVRLVKTSIENKRWFGRYLRRFVKKDAEFAYWQGKKLWENTYLVEFGHKYPDDGEVFALSYLVDTRLMSYIRITGSRVYKDILKSAVQGKFDTSKEKGSLKNAIRVLKEVYIGRGARYFKRTAKYKKTQQLYWKAKKIRSHVFIVSITSYPKEKKDALEQLCPKQDQKQKKACNPKKRFCLAGTIMSIPI